MHINKFLSGAIFGVTLVSLPAIASAAGELCVGDKIRGAAGWAELSGERVFSVNANAIMTKNGLKGSIQYTRENADGIPDLVVHAAAECAGFYNGVAVVAGEGQVQVDGGYI